MLAASDSEGSLGGNWMGGSAMASSSFAEMDAPEKLEGSEAVLVTVRYVQVLE